MTAQSFALLARNIDHARKKAFMAARSTAITMMDNVNVNDHTIAILARDAVANGAATLALKIKGGELEIENNSEAQALLIAYARTACKGVCRDFVRRPKYDSQKLYEDANSLLDGSFELRHICGQRYTNPLDALLAKERREEANQIVNSQIDDDRKTILDAWLDNHCSNIKTAAKLDLTVREVEVAIRRCKKKFANHLHTKTILDAWLDNNCNNTMTAAKLGLSNREVEVAIRRYKKKLAQHLR
jgi:DNA-directed RNA polymerase specialized sigma24 family protein